MKVSKMLSMISINCLMNWKIDDMKKVFYIVGAGLVAGAVATAFYLLNNKKTKECGTKHNYKDADGKRVPEDQDSLREVAITQEEPVYEDVKSSAIGNMYSRHESAAIIMSDSVDTIRANISVSEDTNDEIDEISAELDKMISED